MSRCDPWDESREDSLGRTDGRCDSIVPMRFGFRLSALPSQSGRPICSTRYLSSAGTSSLKDIHPQYQNTIFPLGIHVTEPRHPMRGMAAQLQPPKTGTRKSRREKVNQLYHTDYRRIGLSAPFRAWLDTTMYKLHLPNAHTSTSRITSFSPTCHQTSC